MCIFLQNDHVMQWITFAEVHVKQFVVLIDRLGSVILPGLRMKRHFLHRLRAHLKVWGSSSDISTVLTRKFLMFFPPFK